MIFEGEKMFLIIQADVQMQFWIKFQEHKFQMWHIVFSVWLLVISKLNNKTLKETMQYVEKTGIH